MTRPPGITLTPSDSEAPPDGARAGVNAYRPFEGVPTVLVDEAVRRITASRTFGRSVRHRTFLLHLVRATLEDRQNELKELVIGIAVFGRAVATYDPRRDPIVRVEAGRVRDKLARYYAAEGAAEAFELRIPVGGYLPQIVRRRAAAPAPRHLGSLAVMPFANLSSAPEDAAFCEGIADQLIDRLSRVAGLRVVGRMSAFKARACGLDPKAIGKLLGVTMVLEGSLQRAGARCRCTAQLYRVRDRACIWSQRFDGGVDRLADLFSFEDEIGDAVVAAIATSPASSAASSSLASSSTASSSPGSASPASASVTSSLTPSVTSSTATGHAPSTSTISGTVRAEARDLFERGRYLSQQRTIAGYRKAIDLFERSIALDPDRAAAHARLGTCRSFLGGLTLEPAIAVAREVERHARRALEIDPHDGEARALLANLVFRVQLDWARAEPMFREALQVAPNAAFAHIAFAGALVFNGRALEAVDHGRIALDLDPLNIGIRANYALVCAYARDFATSVAEFRSVLEFDDTHLFAHVMLGMTYLWSGRDALAMEHFDRTIAVAPDHPTAHFCKIFVHGFRGELDVGRRMLATLLARIGTTAHTAFNRAMAEAYLHDIDAMCASLEQVVATREPLFVSLPADPSFDPHRDAPPFTALMARYGLPKLVASPFTSATVQTPRGAAAPVVASESVRRHGGHADVRPSPSADEGIRSQPR